MRYNHSNAIFYDDRASVGITTFLQENTARRGASLSKSVTTRGRLAEYNCEWQHFTHEIGAIKILFFGDIHVQHQPETISFWIHIIYIALQIQKTYR